MRRGAATRAGHGGDRVATLDYPCSFFQATHDSTIASARATTFRKELGGQLLLRYRDLITLLA